MSWTTGGCISRRHHVRATQPCKAHLSGPMQTSASGHHPRPNARLSDALSATWSARATNRHVSLAVAQVYHQVMALVFAVPVQSRPNDCFLRLHTCVTIKDITTLLLRNIASVYEGTVSKAVHPLHMHSPVGAC